MQDNRGTTFWLGLLIFVLGAWLRFYQAETPSLWHDEAFTWYFTSMPWFEMLDTVRMDGVNPPIYYLGTKVVVELFGDSEFILRIPSLIAGIAAIYFAWLLGKETGGPIGGLAGMGFIAFHPMAIHYARDARPYGLVNALSLLLVYIFLKMRKTEYGWWWGGLACVVLVMGQLSHYFFFVLGGVLTAIVALELKRKPRFFRGWALLWIGAFIPLGLWLGWYFAQLSPSLGIGWIERPSIVDPIGTMWNLMSGYGGELSAPSSAFGIIVLGLVLAGTFSDKDSRVGNPAFWLGLIAPVLGVWVLSQRRPVYVDRYFIVILPFLVLLLSMGARWVYERGTNALDENVIRVAALATIAIFIVIGVWDGWQVHTDIKYSREDWRGLVAYLEDYGEASPSLWLSEPEASFPMAYYYPGDLTTATTEPEPPRCRAACWWVMRQPYTATHAFSQAISLPDRDYLPELSPGCRILARWDSPTGVAIWRVVCEE